MIGRTSFDILVPFVLLASHAPFVYACVKQLKSGRLPRSIELVGVSAILYFDVEILFEACGGTYESPFFASFFQAGDVHLLIATIVIAAAPWLVACGYLAASRRSIQAAREITDISRRLSFYVLSALISLALSALSLHLIADAPSLWAARARVGEQFGPYIILLSVPLGILGFYVRQPESHSRFGRVYLGFLMVCSGAANLVTGERTLVLLPLLIVALFWKNPTPSRIFVGGLVALGLAAALLPVFKYQANTAGNSVSDSTQSVLMGDLGRGPVLLDSFMFSEPAGTKIMPYPGSGYVYAVLLYVPRSIAPFKGHSTAVTFTGYHSNTPTEDVIWGLGLGPIDELMLNFGWLALIPGMISYGVAFAFLDRWSMSIPCFGIASSLSAIWLFGYNLPALEQTFGSIVIFGGLWQLIFAPRKRQAHLLRPQVKFLHLPTRLERVNAKL